MDITDLIQMSVKYNRLYIVATKGEPKKHLVIDNGVLFPFGTAAKLDDLKGSVEHYRIRKIDLSLIYSSVSLSKIPNDFLESDLTLEYELKPDDTLFETIFYSPSRFPKLTIGFIVLLVFLSDSIVNALT